MIVPDLTGLQNATAVLNETAADATELVINATEIVRKAKTFGKADVRLSVSNGTGRTTQAKKEPVTSLQDRQTSPACPGANNTMYTDSSKIQYNIHCNADNSYASSDTIEVSVGGYGECFSACSNSSGCGGFTYVGLDAGSCYLKQQMLTEDYAPKNGSNYISCAKVNATAVAPSVTSSSTSNPSGPKKGKTGAVAGGVIAGIAFLALLLLLIALVAKRRRKKIEERRATVTHVFHGPIETQDMTRSSFYRGFSSAQADRQAEDDREKWREENALVPDRPPPSLPPGARAEKNGMFLPATVYKRPSNPSADTVAMLDSTPIKPPQSQSSGSRSPRFHEHVAEMEDTSSRAPPSPAKDSRGPRTPDTDSPTLGRDSNISARGKGPSLADEVRRRQHLMSWNTYDPGQADRRGGNEEPSATMVPRTPPTARSPEQVSPDLGNTPRDSSFVLSPFGSLHREYVAPR
ncbi:hypothetical protein B0A55_07689 [Friedmanniomyces simplex]|uniref:Apple domain-containing protein n=1 Tax=Friedmanniomyces simplex TaxID=329884 RepID=A0A4U0X7G0_9PEZI|nr:hypothetical protein B0A55_07689 [Friedmanniomyces simplex]